MSFTSVILQLSIWIILLPLVAGFLFFKELDDASRVIFYIVVLATIPQLLTASMNHTKDLNIVYNVYTLCEFMFVYFLLGHSYFLRYFNYLSKLLLIVFFIIAIIVIIQNGLYQKFLNELVCTANTLYLIWIFMTIIDSLYNEQKLINVHLPKFWYITGLLIYCPCTIFVFALSYYIEMSKNPLIHNLWSIHSFFNILMYILFTIGFYKSYAIQRKGDMK